MYLEKGMGVGVKMWRSAFFWSVHVYYIYIFIYIDVFMVILVTDTFDNHNLNTLCTSSATWAREL